MELSKRGVKRPCGSLFHLDKFAFVRRCPVEPQRNPQNAVLGNEQLIVFDSKSNEVSVLHEIITSVPQSEANARFDPLRL